MDNVIACPICHSKLSQIDSELVCAKCGTVGECQDGVLDFVGKTGPYWGEVPPERMESVISAAKSMGWRQALWQLSESYPDLTQYLLSPSRVDWLFHCINPSRTGACLDVGSGWGGNSFALAEHFERVYSLEAVKERMDFQRIRKGQSGVGNLSLVRSDWLKLPFEYNQFDLVVLNGVLEWVGLSSPSTNPRTIQLSFLKKISQLLRPGGCVYIGIENRYGYNYLLGARDHSGLKFTGILPRFLADYQVRGLRKTGGVYDRDKRVAEDWDDYRTYTYSLPGYRMLLREAGFLRSDIYWTLNYNDPKYSGTLDGDSVKMLLNHLKAGLIDGKTLYSLATRIGLRMPRSLAKVAISALSPAFLIYAYKGEVGVNLQSQIVDVCGGADSLLKLGGSHSKESKITYILMKDGRSHAIAKIPRFESRWHALRSEEEALSRFNDFSFREEVVNGKHIFIEKPFCGRSPNPGDYHDDSAVIDWLVSFQSRSRTGVWRKADLECRIASVAETLSELRIADSLKLRIGSKLRMFAASATELDISICSEHGDFTTTNMMLDRSGALWVTDWEFFEERGDPFLDLSTYFLDGLSHGGSSNAFERELMRNGKVLPPIRAAMDKYSSATGIPIRAIFLSIPYTTLRCLQRQLSSDNPRQLSHSYYTEILLRWDKLCRDNQLPSTL